MHGHSTCALHSVSVPCCAALLYLSPLPLLGVPCVACALVAVVRCSARGQSPPLSHPLAVGGLRAMRTRR